MLGGDVPNSDIYVVGDTPLDIEAAHAVGCTAVGVATGKYDAEALREAGADHVLDDARGGASAHLAARTDAEAAHFERAHAEMAFPNVDCPQVPD